MKYGLDDFTDFQPIALCALPGNRILGTIYDEHDLHVRILYRSTISAAFSLHTNESLIH